MEKCIVCLLSRLSTASPFKNIWKVTAQLWNIPLKFLTAVFIKFKTEKSDSGGLERKCTVHIYTKFIKIKLNFLRENLVKYAI